MAVGNVGELGKGTEREGSNPARDNHTLIIEYLGAPAGL